MPQMAPISWLVLFMIFSIIFILFNIINYYCFFNKNISSNNNLKINESLNKMNWKW